MKYEVCIIWEALYFTLHTPIVATATQTHSLSKGTETALSSKLWLVKHSRNVLGSKLFCRNEKSFMLLAFSEWMCSTINISRTQRISFSFNEKWGLLLAGVRPVLPHERRNFPRIIPFSPHPTVLDHSGFVHHQPPQHLLSLHLGTVRGEQFNIWVPFHCRGTRSLHFLRTKARTHYAIAMSWGKEAPGTGHRTKRIRERNEQRPTCEEATPRP